MIADQFDDYQARHRSRFVDDEGNWLTPAALARVEAEFLRPLLAGIAADAAEPAGVSHPEEVGLYRHRRLRLA